MWKSVEFIRNVLYINDLQRDMAFGHDSISDFVGGRSRIISSIAFLQPP